MILETAASVSGFWALRRLIHMGVVRDLRAPRVPFTHMPNAFGLPPDRVQEVHISTIGAKRLIEWLVLPPQATGRRLPAILVMHGLMNAGID